MTDSIIAQRVLVRDMPDRSRIVATLQIHQLSGNAHPYFSATCGIYEAHGTWSGAARQRNGRDWDCGGAAHREILRAFPGAAPFVAMHLSDYPAGVPMHAEANALYFLRNGDAETAARTLRFDSSTELLRALPYRFDPNGEDAAATFATFVDTLRPHWKAEARAARALLDLMPDALDLRGYDMRGEATEVVPLPEWLTGAAPERVSV